MDLYNSTNAFMKLGYTDINLLYFLILIGVIFFIVSRIPFDKVNKVSNIMFSLLSFAILVGTLYMSMNSATFIVQPQWNENISAWNGAANYTNNHTYLSSKIDVIPQNSTALSVILIIISLFSFLNFVELLSSLIEANKIKVEAT